MLGYVDLFRFSNHVLAIHASPCEMATERFRFVRLYAAIHAERLTTTVSYSRLESAASRENEQEKKAPQTISVRGASFVLGSLLGQLRQGCATCQS
jgi:hypothetical protein